MTSSSSSRSPARALIVAASLVLLLHVAGASLPFVSIIEAPLLWLSTFAHESGHGLAAQLVGGRFESLVLSFDGSGVAHSTGVVVGTPEAIVSAGGLLGPALVAALFFFFGTRPRLAHLGLVLWGTVMLLVAALVVRNAFGLVFTIGAGAAFLWAARKLTSPRAQTLVLFLAVQLALSVFSRGDYLFTDTAHMSSGDVPSDVAHMANGLGGAYWMWGLAVGSVSVIVLVAGLALVYLAERLHARHLATR